ncbi:lysophospholipid acyltransferase family protein [Rhodococcus opacus]|uniref:Lysophospholipid acyltransferase family protein n=1 Tax=Rhodococcus opacus TaxID=37919 RepID=A0AAX3YI37_RHOOP|nr:lysophospholipid acyltransferase family protein [Rhodococcus opacus]MCZ4584091.1 lysophospholipid acyltransferase family protein [Rhodococcus opacus]MDV6245633.1 lysophospholipid acyltransferase family protein [Rhodococcus opacus]QZS53431.1 1-acyl-sn-glycerol-3-phosphate acyltransferase [Rhodococcus opacus]RKM73492.1 1-acyl-sn-glycerol-3-phosphate acyltransferase [Rhodococcus opacus]UZG56108.1 1-acyl-sn-glycerol-3-phosphate acyltransferase [Rhodococcus opacus]
MEPVFVESTAKALSLFQGLRMTRVGLDNIPTEGGAVLAVNHTGYLDFVQLALAVGAVDRKLRLMAKAELAHNKVMAFLMRGCGVIPVDRTAGAGAYLAAVERLREGELVGVYPEATISRSFEIKELKSGAARMAIDARVPLVPVIVWGAYRHDRQPRQLGRHRFPVTVEVGRPIEPREPAEALTETLHTEMDTILRRVQDGFDHPAGAYWVPRRLGGSAPTIEEATEMDRREAEERRAR